MVERYVDIVEAISSILITPTNSRRFKVGKAVDKRMTPKERREFYRNKSKAKPY